VRLLAVENRLATEVAWELGQLESGIVCGLIDVGEETEYFSGQELEPAIHPVLSTFGAYQSWSKDPRNHFAG